MSLRQTAAAAAAALGHNAHLLTNKLAQHRSSNYCNLMYAQGTAKFVSYPLQLGLAAVTASAAVVVIRRFHRSGAPDTRYHAFMRQKDETAAQLQLYTHL
jgi:hypothetical protein